jgi:hypothetical protein
MDRIRPKPHESEHGAYDTTNADRLRSYSASHLLNLKGGRFDQYPARRLMQQRQLATKGSAEEQRA